MEIIRQRDGNYAVQSETTERMYVVSAKADACSCPHSTYRAPPDCKHRQAVRAHLEAQTKLSRAADKAANLTEQELIRFAREKNGTSAGAACLLELARRQVSQPQPEPRPIPPGVECFLVGANPEERERALAVYQR